jgi:hypothetical protein
MIDPVYIRIVTVLVFFVGLACGYWFRKWADRVKGRGADEAFSRRQQRLICG